VSGRWRTALGGFVRKKPAGQDAEHPPVYRDDRDALQGKVERLEQELDEAKREQVGQRQPRLPPIARLILALLGILAVVTAVLMGITVKKKTADLLRSTGREVCTRTEECCRNYYAGRARRKEVSEQFCEDELRELTADCKQIVEGPGDVCQKDAACMAQWECRFGNVPDAYCGTSSESTDDAAGAAEPPSLPLPSSAVRLASRRGEATHRSGGCGLCRSAMGHLPRTASAPLPFPVRRPCPERSTNPHKAPGCPACLGKNAQYREKISVRSFRRALRRPTADLNLEGHDEGRAARLGSNGTASCQERERPCDFVER
jgi:hypothetical protein